MYGTHKSNKISTERNTRQGRTGQDMTTIHLIVVSQYATRYAPAPHRTAHTHLSRIFDYNRNGFLLYILYA